MGIAFGKAREEAGHSVSDLKQMMQDPEVQKEFQGYKDADKLMNNTLLRPDDDIYIQCNPVTVDGEEIENEQDNNINLNSISNVQDQVFSEMANASLDDGLFTNVGYQVLVGLVLLGIVYLVGNHIFISTPKSIIDT